MHPILGAGFPVRAKSYELTLMTDCDKGETRRRATVSWRDLRPRLTVYERVPLPPYEAGQFEIGAQLFTPTIERIQRCNGRGESTGKLLWEYIIGNAAPREFGKKKAPFGVVVLPGNFLYVGTVAGPELSLLKDKLDLQKSAYVDMDRVLRELSFESLDLLKTHYRSRFLGEVLSRLLGGDTSHLLERIEPDDISDKSGEPYVLTDDDEQNLKTSIADGDKILEGRKEGDRFTVTINGRSVEGVFGTKLDGVGPHVKLLLTRGSSPASLDDSSKKFWDLFEPKGGTHQLPGHAGALFVNACNAALPSRGLPLPGDKILFDWM